jgi:uracil-DNA glycosylase
MSVAANPARRQALLNAHVAQLVQCRRCPHMLPPPVSGGPIMSRVVLVGQAPGVREPVLAKPFAWTAGRTLFRWFEESCGMNETAIRALVYFAAVCRCFPGKAPGGGDRVPAPDEIRNCSSWMNDEFEILRPRLVIPVGKLAIAQFIPFDKLDKVISRKFSIHHGNTSFDLIPLPHPSGASPWPKISPGRELTRRALRKIARHPEMLALRKRAARD